MSVVDLDALPSWDLKLKLGGSVYTVRRPTWEELPALEKALTDDSDALIRREREKLMRGVLAPLLAKEAGPMVDGLPYNLLLAALFAVDAYFGKWLGSQISLAAAAAAPIGAGGGGLEPAASAPKKGLEAFAPWMKRRAPPKEAK